MRSLKGGYDMNNKWLLLLILFGVCISFANAQDEIYDFEEEDWVSDTVYIPVHDTTYIYISNLNDITQKLGISYDSYVRWFLYFVSRRDSGHLFSPQEIYLNYFLPLLENQSDPLEHKWVEGVFSLYASPDTAFMKYNRALLPDNFQTDNRSVDIIFECRGDKNTDYFLQSPKLIDTYLVQLFKYIHETNKREARKIKGVNFYFPDFSFHKKRAMAQFAKSVSLVTNSCLLNTIRDLKVYFSFDKKTVGKQQEYLACISEMTDSIFVFDNQANPLFSTAEVITQNNANKYWLLSKAINQVYMSSFYIDYFPAVDMFEFRENDIIKLIHADYPENNWEVYAFVLAGILLLALILFILYFTVPEFAYFLMISHKYLTIIILMLLFEIFLLFFSMLEAMSRSSVFDFSSKDKDLILFMPLLLVFIAPLLKLFRNGDKP
ncbi:MAG: hypothetical protein LBR97_05820 [Dysgonamonadaceae bacterium]|jgi:hypothetical protein|nr:hypothetical protein [Dysgonamonadaceae bacterium]